MAAEGDWSLFFYRSQARFGWSMEQLRQRNVLAREPLVKHLEGQLWELREESATNIYRVVYFIYTGRRIVFVHGFQKKSRRTPRKEIEIARTRYLTFLQSQRGG
jgi:phage-related protein